MSLTKVCYVWDENLIEHCNRLPAVMNRASMVHNLIQAYGLLSKLKVVRSLPASYNDMREFHSDLYLDHLKCFLEVDDDYMTSTHDEEYGIGYDCPPVSNMYELVSWIAGGSVTAAKCLILGLADVAINWCGGWHHAHRFGAEGFCYINDIVIAIAKLRKKFSKVLYIDLDVHHGNGVQDAYNLSKSVFTLSFHKYEPGFYPGSGSVDDIGSLGATGYACNVPLRDCYSDDSMQYIFQRVFSMVWSYFTADAIVVQCGADALAHDPNGGATLSARSYCYCIRTVLDKRKPTMLLGGGGYNHANAARLWTTLTAMITGVELDEEIPEHSEWPEYGPTYRMDFEPTLTKDSNKSTDIEEVITKIKGNLEKYLGKASNPEPLAKKSKTDSENTDIHFNVNKKTDQTNNQQNDVNTYRKIKGNVTDLKATRQSEDSKDVYDFVE